MNFKAIAAAAAVTICSLNPAPAKAADYCRGNQGWNMCATYGRYYDILDITTDSASLTMKVRCTEPTSTTYRWSWEVMRSRNVRRGFPEQAAKSYCQGRLGIS